MKKVLLLSPVEGRDEAGGDRTYTHVLCAHSPRGVQYETYDRALERGALRERGTGRAIKAALSRARELGARRLAGEALCTLAGKSLYALRSRRRLFWEPFLFYEIRRGEYDLVHSHIFSARFEGLDCPLVMSMGGRLRHLYLDARSYAPTRVQQLEKADHLLGRALRVNVSGEWMPDASQLYAFTLSGRDELRAKKVLPSERISYIPFHLPLPELRPRDEKKAPHHVGFVAREFAFKGGPLLLQAWEEVRRARPDARLTIVGSPPRETPEALGARGIEWLPFIPRQRLLDEVMPSFDVFAYPTNYDYLPCYSILEVMARGVPIAGSDHRDMDVALGDRAGLLCPKRNAGALAANILKLLEPNTNRTFRAGARAHFEDNFSPAAVLPQLEEVYRKAVSS